ncbi:MAG: hypothetical protein ACLQVJ_07315 [Syntrophobacteraceae bacterium]
MKDFSDKPWYGKDYQRGNALAILNAIRSAGPKGIGEEGILKVVRPFGFPSVDLKGRVHHIANEITRRGLGVAKMDGRFVYSGLCLSWSRPV